MFQNRQVVLQHLLAAALTVSGSALITAGCTGDRGDAGGKGDPGVKGDPGAPGTGGLGNQGPAGNPGDPALPADQAAQFATATPIKHVVVIYGENVSFDHYFATYPEAANRPAPDKETPFKAADGTPMANNLLTPLDVNNGFAPIAGPSLLTVNPNTTDPQNTTQKLPFRLTPKQASTADQNHAYSAEQAATHAGGMDVFPSMVGVGNPNGSPFAADKSLVLGYYDGNAVSALWNYAQRFAMNDNSWSTQFGPSTPGALNLISGQTNGAVVDASPSGQVIDDGHGGMTVIGDPQPFGDACSDVGRTQVHMAGKNVGDLLNEHGITWGAFMGGFDLTIVNPGGSFGCARTTSPTQGAFVGNASVDYIPHHAWFQYYETTANPLHERPSSLQAVGSSKALDGTPEPANHNYDSHDFFDALAIGNLPAVSFVKAPAFQDGHGGYSNPIDEQSFIVGVVNALQASRFWGTTAVIIAYDDSDGWYDHQAPPIVNQSSAAADQLNGAGSCLTANSQQLITTPANLKGANGTDVANGRCGYGTRVPLLVVSPRAKKNFIDHTLTDQSSVLRFIEDNWLGGKRIQDGGSADTIAGSIMNMFDFAGNAAQVVSRTVWLDPHSGQEVPQAAALATAPGEK
jgi:phospholipase C